MTIGSHVLATMLRQQKALAESAATEGYSLLSLNSPTAENSDSSHDFLKRSKNKTAKIMVSEDRHREEYRERRQRNSVVAQRSHTIGAKLGGRSNQAFNASRGVTFSHDEGSGILKWFRKKLNTIRGRRTQRDIDIHAILDPEITITRDEADGSSDNCPSEYSDQQDELQRKCHCECWFEPSSHATYWWTLIVCIAVLYNYWVIIYRFAFDEIQPPTLLRWFMLDYSMDLIYLLDILVGFRTGYLDEGVLQINSDKMRLRYMNSMVFYVDCLCLLPLDFLYLSIDFQSLLRCFRYIKIYKFWRFLETTERHANYPNVVRTLTMIHYLLLIFHWNGCLFYKVMNDSSAFTNNELFQNKTQPVYMNYLHSVYWSILTLTTISPLPQPRDAKEYVYTIITMVCALLLFATIMGLVAHIVSSMHAARKDFQGRLDAVKIYMRQCNVPPHLQSRVIKWFDYLWAAKKNVRDSDTFDLLPDKLKAEIAIHTHLDTLKKVEIFQNTEAGFLKELVLRLEPVLFSPGDLICRKGEVGKEMYIVKRGRLHVVDSSDKVLAVLQPGSYFGEISILNMGDVGNKRTASVKSVGFSDLFCLKKNALWDVLQDYPAARVRLEAIAVKRLQREDDSSSKQQGTRQQQTVKPFFQDRSALQGRPSTSSMSKTVEALTVPEVKIPTSEGISRKTSFICEDVISRSRRSSAKSNHSDLARTVDIDSPNESRKRSPMFIRRDMDGPQVHEAESCT